jgi:GT2 family glycosyltransferase
MNRIARGLWRRLWLLALKSAERWPAASPPVPDPGPWQPGIAVLIPECGTPALLSAALASVAREAASWKEALAVHVLVNGAPEIDYAELQSQHPTVHFAFHADALGYAGAIAAGLNGIHADWVLLLNSDASLEPGALAALAAARGPRVFAIAAAISTPDGRREETGYTLLQRQAGAIAEAWDLEPPGCIEGPIPHLYAGGGASLFRTQLLQRHLDAARDFDPAYFEDADWGIRAWREGRASLYQPAAQVRHVGGATTTARWSAAALDALRTRNRLLLELRHGLGRLSWAELNQIIANAPLPAQQQLHRPRVLLGAWRERRLSAFARSALAATPVHAPPSAPPHSALTRPGTPPAGGRVLLMVTPFAPWPPTHGSARRVLALAEAMRARGWQVALLTDEDPELPELVSTPFRWIDGVRGRPSAPAAPGMARMRAHVHDELRRRLRQWRMVLVPDAILVCHGELLGLVQDRGHERWLLDLHDVEDWLGTPGAQRLLGRYDRVLWASPADPAPRLDALLCPNGAEDRRVQWQPSADAAPVLFMGALRYPPNREGLHWLLQDVWPGVRAAVPEARLRVLGGEEAADLELVPGVSMEARYADPAAALAGALCTVNPQFGIRGSALKIAESLLAGRITLSTTAGARGYADWPGLLRRDRAEEWIETLVHLHRDGTHRHALERPLRALDGLAWSRAGEVLAEALA